MLLKHAYSVIGSLMFKFTNNNYNRNPATQRTFFEDMSTFFLHDILRALQILLTVRLSGYV